MSEDRRDLVRYTAAIALYIAIGFFTKRLLTWNLAFAYFLVVLEVLPRSVRRWWPRRSSGAIESTTGLTESAT